MNTVILFLFLGTLTGYIIRKKKNILKYLDRITFFSVLVLLFLLGFSVGRDNVIIGSLHELGLQALLLSVSAISGSAVVSLFVYRIYFRDFGKDEK